MTCDTIPINLKVAGCEFDSVRQAAQLLQQLYNSQLLHSKQDRGVPAARAQCHSSMINEQRAAKQLMDAIGLGDSPSRADQADMLIHD